MIEMQDAFLSFKTALNYFQQVDHWERHKFGVEILLPLVHITLTCFSMLSVWVEMKLPQLEESEVGLLFSCKVSRCLS